MFLTMANEQKNFKHIVRIMNTDLDGSKPLINALRKIKGVNFAFANLTCKLAGVDHTKQTGTLSDSEVSKLTEILKDPTQFNTPSWMLNRRNDIEDGVDKHLITTDLRLTQDNDIKLMKKIKSYRGIRHMSGLPLRGQRTKSNFRRNKGKGSLGVKKKK